MTIADLLVHARKFASDNSPAILTAVATAGVVTTAVLAGKAAVKAHDILNKEKLKRSDEIGVPADEILFTPEERVKLAWKAFVPPAGACAATIACIIAANQIGTRRAASVAAAYSVLERGFAEYKDKVVERLGEKKERDLRDEIVQDRMTNNPPSQAQVIITGAGDHLCYDMFSGRYFLSNIEALRRAENRINKQINGESYASLTDFYREIGLRPTDASDEVGWTADGDMLELITTSVLTDEEKPALGFSFNVKPFRGYYHGHR